jgi:hypothetical protein
MQPRGADKAVDENNLEWTLALDPPHWHCSDGKHREGLTTDELLRQHGPVSWYNKGSRQYLGRGARLA